MLYEQESIDRISAEESTMNDNDGNNSTGSQIESEVTFEDVWNEAVREIKQIDPSESKEMFLDCV